MADDRNKARPGERPDSAWDGRPKMSIAARIDTQPGVVSQAVRDEMRREDAFLNGLPGGGARRGFRRDMLGSVARSDLIR